MVCHRNDLLILGHAAISGEVCDFQSTLSILSLLFFPPSCYSFSKLKRNSECRMDWFSFENAAKLSLFVTVSDYVYHYFPFVYRWFSTQTVQMWRKYPTWESVWKLILKSWLFKKSLNAQLKICMKFSPILR